MWSIYFQRWPCFSASTENWPRSWALSSSIRSRSSTKCKWLLPYFSYFECKKKNINEQFTAMEYYELEDAISKLWLEFSTSIWSAWLNICFCIIVQSDSIHCYYFSIYQINLLLIEFIDWVGSELCSHSDHVSWSVLRGPTVYTWWTNLQMKL